MPKYARDVNKQTKIIDVQKQFPGGLKTVDTDDALGRVYLRDVENISLSEFSFLEKRYGLREDEIFLFESSFPNVDTIQGYFEYTKDDGGVDRILFANGRAYIRQAGESLYRQVEFFTSEPDTFYNYPPQSDLEEVFDVDFYQAEGGPMAVPTLLTTNDGIGVLEVSAVNRDFESAEIFYKINSGSFISLGVLSRNGTAAIPGIPIPTGATVVTITVYAKDPNETREDSQEFSQEYREFRNITATFAMDGGSPQIQPITIGTSGSAFIEEPTVAISKTGFTFLGSPNGWSPTLPRTINENTTFTAQYGINTYTITYNSNGGTSVGQQTYNFGQATQAPTPPTRAGFFFDGWFTNSNLTTRFTFGQPMPANNITLFAGWFQTRLRMRVFGRYTDALGSNVTIPGGVVVSTQLPGQSAVNRTLTNSLQTISDSIVPNSTGGQFVAPTTVNATAAGGAAVTWSFLRWDITIGSTNYTFNNTTLTNPFTPSSGGSGSTQLYTAAETIITPIYTAARPNYPLTLSTNKTSGDRSGLIAFDANNFQWENDPANPNVTLQSIPNNFNTTLQIPEGRGFNLRGPIPDPGWNYNGWFRTDTNQRIAPQFTNEPILNIGFTNVGLFWPNGQASYPYPVEARFFQSGSKIHPALTLSQTYNSTTKELQFRIRNNNISDYGLVPADDFPNFQGQKYFASISFNVFQGTIFNGFPVFADRVIDGLTFGMEGGYDSQTDQFATVRDRLKITNIQPGDVYGIVVKVELLRTWKSGGGGMVTEYPTDSNSPDIIYARRTQTLLSSILT